MDSWFGEEIPHTFLHGDQLTIERVANLIRLLKSERPELKKLIPGIVDWHARYSFVDVRFRVEKKKHINT